MSVKELNPLPSFWKNLIQLERINKLVNKTIQINDLYNRTFTGLFLLFDPVNGELILKSDQGEHIIFNLCDLSQIQVINAPRVTESFVDLIMTEKQDNYDKLKMPLFMQNNNKMKKYWLQRYSLFSLYDQGIKLDQESFFSVTPEATAAHIAHRLQTSKYILELFTGSGGNLIQFAKKAGGVIGVDHDEEKLNNARQNSEVYGVSEKVQLVYADAFEVLTKFHLLRGDKGLAEIDTIFMSPPWGGPSYSRKDFKLSDKIVPTRGDLVSIEEFIVRAVRACKKVAVFLPKSVSMEEVTRVVSNLPPTIKTEVERHRVNQEIRTTCLYIFSD